MHFVSIIKYWSYLHAKNLYSKRYHIKTYKAPKIILELQQCTVIEMWVWNEKNPLKQRIINIIDR